MELWIHTVLMLASSAAITGASEDVAIDNAIRTCNHKLGTNFDFKFANAPPKQVQSGGFFFNFVSYRRRRPDPRLARLFPWLRRPSAHQFVLTTTWKKPLTEATAVRPGGDAGDTITKSCSAYLTNQEPVKYVLTCNGTQEGKVEEKTVEVPLISVTDKSIPMKCGKVEEKTIEIPPISDTEKSISTEESEMDEGEEANGDDTWNLSRCLGCIFELLQG
ncbi:uncharacterized protein ACMZJ9_008866 [Mantella aurantiaca]